MTRYRDSLPQLKDRVFLAYVGMETDLIFNKGLDLPGFASYPLLETEEGRAMLAGYLSDLVAIGKANGHGVVLESPTWVANRDRGTFLGYTPERLLALNKQAIKLMADVREKTGDLPTVLSANIGPREDAYAPEDQMTPDQAASYHAEQVGALADTDVDLISGYTIAYPDEAIGMVQAARRFNLPVVISFTLETDGRLPTGTPLEEAIDAVDTATDNYASYYMINCAHPDHFDDVLAAEPWMQRLRGVVANASRCSHAELDNAQVLDDGDPAELGLQIAQLRRRFPQINVVGGCCGTDMRHMSQIAEAARLG